MRRSFGSSFVGVVGVCLLASSASAAFQLTNFGGGTNAPLSISGDVASSTVLAGSAELEIVTNGGFKNAFDWFVPRSMAQQMVANPIFEMPRRNTPVAGGTPTDFINTFFVLNSDAAGRTGYVVDIPPAFLFPGAPGSDVFTVDLSAHAGVWAALNAYANETPGSAGSYAVIHIVQQSGDSSSGARIAYGDLRFRAIPEPASMAAVACAMLLGLRRR